MRAQLWRKVLSGVEEQEVSRLQKQTGLFFGLFFFVLCSSFDLLG